MRELNAGKKNLSLKAFNDFVHFFFAVRAGFSRFQVNEAVTTSTLLLMLQAFGFDFPKESLAQFITFFDFDNSGALELNEVFAMTLFLYTAESVFLSDPSIRVNGIAPEDLGAILRAMSMPLIPTELKVLGKIIPGQKFKIGSFGDLVSLIEAIKLEMPKIKEMGKAAREQKKIKKPKKAPAKKVLENNEALREANALKDRVLAECKRTGKKWVDPEFPPEARILFPANPDRSKVIQHWLRPEKLSRNPAIFVDGIEEGDVVQGALADCYLLSALSVLAAAPNNEVENIFLHSFPEQGFYQCRFFINNEWMYVAVDDLLPCNEHEKLWFGTCKDPDEFWVQIVEKAYAKLHGSYGAIESGLIGDALTDITGAPHEVIQVNESKALWDKIIKYQKKGCYMGCASERPDLPDEHDHNAPNDMGIFQNHAYGILDAQEVQGNKLLRLRNPWGKEEWNGAWSDDSKEWTDELLNHFNYSGENDGTFFMEFSDWCNEFNQCLCAHILDAKWTVQKFGGRWQKPNFAGGCINQPTWMKNPQYRIKSPISCEVIISLTHTNLRHKLQKSVSEYQAAGVTVLHRDQKDNHRQEVLKSRAQVKAISKFVNIREALASFEVEANEEYSVIVSSYLPNYEGNWNIRFCSQGPLEATHLTTTSSMTAVRGAWQGLTAGGCPNHLTWHRCPQYLLTVTKEMDATISIVQERIGDSFLNHIGFHVFTAHPEKKSVLDPSTSIYECKYQNASTVSGTVHLKEGVYNVVATTFEPGQEGKFGMVVQPAAASLKPIENDWSQYNVVGKWKNPSLSGGAPAGTAGEWKNNPRVWFEITTPTYVNFVLTLKTPNIRGIGFCIVESDKEKSKGNRIHVSPFKTDHEVVMHVGVMKPGCYIVLPCTYQPKQEGDWELMAFTSPSVITLLNLDKAQDW